MKYHTTRSIRFALVAAVAAGAMTLAGACAYEPEDEYDAAAVGEEAAEDYAAGEESYAAQEPMGEEPMGEGADETMVGGVTEPPTGVAELEISVVQDQPEAWYDRSVHGEVEVADRDMTDRAFWVEQDGAELFVVLTDEPATMPMEIEPGQRLRLGQATLMGPEGAGQLPGTGFDEATLKLLAEEEVFLLVDRDSIEVLEPASARRGG